MSLKLNPKDMYLNKNITFITDFRENRIEQFECFLKNDSDLLNILYKSKS